MITYLKLVLRFTTVAVIIALTGLACGDDDDGSDTAGGDNILSNGGFEDGAEGWTAQGVEATVSNDQANTGSSSLLTVLSVDEQSVANSAAFAFQETRPEEAPDFMSFDYYVEDWVRGTDKQYIEAVIIITGSGAGMPECPGGEPCPNIQLRYVLSGISIEPSVVHNARWRFVGEEEPVTGEWIHFETDVRNDLTEEWGSLPVTIDSIKLQLEIRYDERSSDELDTAATVYWDDVYLGPR